MAKYRNHEECKANDAGYEITLWHFCGLQSVISDIGFVQKLRQLALSILHGSVPHYREPACVVAIFEAPAVVGR